MLPTVLYPSTSSYGVVISLDHHLLAFDTVCMILPAFVRRRRLEASAVDADRGAPERGEAIRGEELRLPALGPPPPP